MMSQDHPEKDEVKLAEEAAWVQRACKGDQDALIQLYERYIDRVYHYFCVRVGNVSEAEALTSETFTRATEKLLAQNRYSWQGKPFGIWLFGIAANVLREHRRALDERWNLDGLDNVLWHDEPSGEEGIFSTIERLEERNALWRLVRALPDAERNILVMRHRDGLSYAEIAQRLNRSENACKQLHYRALQKLKLITQEAGLWSKSERGESEHNYSLPAQMLPDEVNTPHSIKEYREHSLHNEEQENSVFATLTTCLINSYVEKALEDLPLLERSCLLLYADAQFSEAEIAGILDLDEEAVYRYLQTGSQHWLHAYSSLLEKELGIPLSTVAVSAREDFSRVKRLIGYSHHGDVSTQHVNGNVSSAVN